MNKRREVLEKFANQLSNLWKVSTPYPVKALDYQKEALTALNKLEKEKIKSFKEIIKKHYEVFGYEKQHYLKEELEKMLDINIKVDGEQNLQRGQDE